jgi:transcriptional regulator with XRE-family HTH domain
VLSKHLIAFSQVIELEYANHYMSKLDFAIACDVDEKTIRRILKGEQNISIEILIKIADALKTKPSLLLQKISL